MAQPLPHISREGFVWARNTTTNAKEYVPAHWVGSSWFPQYKHLKSSEAAAARPADLDKEPTGSEPTADDTAAAATTKKGK